MFKEQIKYISNENSEQKGGSHHCNKIVREGRMERRNGRKEDKKKGRRGGRK